MKNNITSKNEIQGAFAYFAGGCQLIAAIGAVLSLTACGNGKPGASDIEPYIKNVLGQCELWTVSDVRKVDGIEEGKSYRVDFTAALTLKQSPEQARQSYIQHKMDPSWIGCHTYISNLAVLNANQDKAELVKQYNVSGFGMLIKSEQGWRLVGDNLHLEFAPASGSENATAPTPVPPVAQSNKVEEPPAQSTPAYVTPELAPVAAPLSACVAKKMSEWEKKRDNDMALASKEAADRGEELRVSAGQEELMKQEALDKATLDCR
ncbi:hypothetical protein [Undibacterium sp. TJN19]|uniref:hypothetical protein n=1 Tax=Undibacterium sp. TJN19 TaxID=3413055 RepID=UPI003BF30B16